jgi:plasmid stabilization system protein ParE
MAYEVILTSRAERDLNEAADWIAKESLLNARRWFDNFVAKLNSLATHPERCGFTREQPKGAQELRQLLFGRSRSYRAVFTIRNDQVIILTIRHTARGDFDPSEVIDG